MKPVHFTQSSSTPALSLSDATRVIQRFFEGIRPQEDAVLDAALRMKNLSLETVKGLKRAARGVERRGCRAEILVAAGAGKNR